jgi:hypothetical protein
MWTADVISRVQGHVPGRPAVTLHSRIFHEVQTLFSHWFLFSYYSYCCQLGQYIQGWWPRFPLLHVAL